MQYANLFFAFLGPQKKCFKLTKMSALPSYSTRGRQVSSVSWIVDSGEGGSGSASGLYQEKFQIRKTLLIWSVLICVLLLRLHVCLWLLFEVVFIQVGRLPLVIGAPLFICCRGGTWLVHCLQPSTLHTAPVCQTESTSFRPRTSFLFCPFVLVRQFMSGVLGFTAAVYFSFCLVVLDSKKSLWFSLFIDEQHHSVCFACSSALSSSVL